MSVVFGILYYKGNNLFSVFFIPCLSLDSDIIVLKLVLFYFIIFLPDTVTAHWSDI